MACLEILKSDRVVGRIMLPGGEGPTPLRFLSLDNEDPRTVSPRLNEDRPADFLSAIQRVGSRWVLICPVGSSSVRVNGILLVCLKILDHGDLVDLAVHRLRLSEEVQETLAAEAPLISEGKACPVCREEYAPGDRVIYCPRCGLSHHLDCWNYYGKCSSTPFCGYVIPHTVAATGHESRGQG